MGVRRRKRSVVNHCRQLHFSLAAVSFLEIYMPSCPPPIIVTFVHSVVVWRACKKLPPLASVCANVLMSRLVWIPICSIIRCAFDRRCRLPSATLFGCSRKPLLKASHWIVITQHAAANGVIANLLARLPQM